MVANDADLIGPMRANPLGWNSTRTPGAGAEGYATCRGGHPALALSNFVLGYKYNMNYFAASIGHVQLRRLDLFNARRGLIIAPYLNRLAGVISFEPLPIQGE